MPDRARVSLHAVRTLLMGGDEPGVFETLLGFRAATEAIRGVHIMNDLAQCVLGGAPEHGGDFLCQVVRPDDDGAENSEEALRNSPRFGRAFARAFPDELGRRRVDALRRAATAVLNFDRGMYKAGDRMASALATHRDLLGFEQFRRFQVGRYIEHALGEDGARQVRDLYETDHDPITRAFRPLLLPGDLVDTQKRRPLPPRTEFDEALGRGLRTLLTQRLAKPALLRALALASSLGIVLKVLGRGRPTGTPAVLALAAEREASRRRDLREEAVTSIRRCVADFDRACSLELSRHPGLQQMLASGHEEGAFVEFGTNATVLDQCAELIAAARRDAGSSRTTDDDTRIWWPDRFAVRLGRQGGFILPQDDRAGWGRYFALSPEHVEVLTLMCVPPGQRRSWKELWSCVRTDFGIVVGVNAPAEAVALRDAGVLHVGVEALAANGDDLLAQACRRALARRLPDSGAEVGGTT